MDKLDLIAAKSEQNDKTKWLPIKIHALDTAGIMEILFNKWLSNAVRNYIIESFDISVDRERSEEIICNFCRLIALLHDIGKITPAFQSKISDNIAGHTNMLYEAGMPIKNIFEPEKSPHDLAGQAIAKEYKFAAEISAIIGAHHGRINGDNLIRNQLTAYKENYFGKQNAQESIWRGLWTEWINYAMAETDFKSVDDLPKPDIKVQMVLCGLLIMSDWIASNQNYFPYVECNRILDEEQCRQRVINAWEALDFPESWNAENIYDLNAFFLKRFGFAANQVQESFMQAVDEASNAGIYILEAPMGVGKTEAALSAAEIIASKSGANGIFFGLPTQATANGIFGRICDWAKKCDNEKHSIRLAHGMTELNDEYQELFHGRASASEDDIIFVHEWFEGRKQALLSDFVIATVDQFLLASLKQKHVMLRHLGLAGKVVIIDECHAYDAYMNIYLDRTLTWMGAYHVPVIILSATLPPKRRKELIEAYLGRKTKNELSDIQNSLAYPIITWTNEHDIYQKPIMFDGENKYICVSKIAEEKLTEVLKDKLSGGGCAAVIVNTVNYAQELSKSIKQDVANCEVICFHSHFIASDRAKIEKTILTRVGKKSKDSDRNGLIVVGTQVLEQSLDVDFDYMITEMCPMDLLLQRSGRLQRHSRKRPNKLIRPELTIICPESIKDNHIYSRWLLQRTEKYLPDELIIPQCIPDLVGKVYTEAENDEERDSEEWQEYEKMLNDKKERAKTYCIESKLLRSRYTKTLADILDNAVENSVQAEATVRDTDETIEVLALRAGADNMYHLMSGEASFDSTLALCSDEAKSIAKERLRLPIYFSKYHFNDTFDALNTIPKNWRDSKWLSGELLLLFDENGEALLCGKKLCYSNEYGLEVMTME